MEKFFKHSAVSKIITNNIFPFNTLKQEKKKLSHNILEAAFIDILTNL